MMEVGVREQGEDWGGREWSRGGREEAMMLGRERASVEEGRVEGGWVDEGTERGMERARERWEGGSERRRDWARKGGSKGVGEEGGKKTSREVSRGGHRPVYSIFTNHSTTRPLALRLWYYK